MVPFICHVENRQIHRERKWIRGCQGAGWRGDSHWLSLKGMRFLAGVMKMLRNQVTGIVAQPCKYTKTTELCELCIL